MAARLTNMDRLEAIVARLPAAVVIAEDSGTISRPDPSIGHARPG